MGYSTGSITLINEDNGCRILINYREAWRLMDILFKYYGIDWTAMVMTCCFLYYVGEEKRSGFVFGILASIAWLAFGILAESIANVIANLIFITLNARGYLKWKKKAGPAV